MDGYWRGFLLDRRASKASPKTLQWHETSYKRLTEFIAETGQSSVPLDWDATFLREFIVWLQERKGRNGEPLSDFTVRTWVNSIFAYCKWLFNEEVLVKDITARVKKPKLPDIQKPSFTGTEMNALIKAAKSTRYALRDTAIMLTLFDTGIRSSELCNLRIGDFLQDTLILVIKQGKGRKDRVVPISVKTAVAITKYLNKMRMSGDRFGEHPRRMSARVSGTDMDAPLFIGERGKLTTSGLESLVKRLAKAADVENVHPHRFRHTAALFLLRNGADIVTVQRILGHTNIEMTKKYIDLLHDDLSRVHALASPVTNLM